jgi:prophage regulatory protein
MQPKEQYQNLQVQEHRASRFLRLPEVKGKIGCSRSTLLNWVKAGTFPAPVKLSARMIAWRVEDVDQWVASRAKAGAL